MGISDTPKNCTGVVSTLPPIVALNPMLLPYALIQAQTNTRHEDAPSVLLDSTDRQVQLPSATVAVIPYKTAREPLPGPRTFNRRVLTGLKAKR